MIPKTMPPTPRLHFILIFRSALDYRSDLLARLRECNRSRDHGEVQIEFMDGGYSVEEVILE